MIDIHSHVLPCVDDGANYLAESLNMIQDAISLGITDIVLTPHYEMSPIRMKPGINIQKEFDSFKNELKNNNLDINLYLGNEITVDNNILNIIK